MTAALVKDRTGYVGKGWRAVMHGSYGYLSVRPEADLAQAVTEFLGAGQSYAWTLEWSHMADCGADVFLVEPAD